MLSELVRDFIFIPDKLKGSVFRSLETKVCMYYVAPKKCHFHKLRHKIIFDQDIIKKYIKTEVGNVGKPLCKYQLLLLGYDGKILLYMNSIFILWHFPVDCHILIKFKARKNKLAKGNILYGLEII